MKQNVRHRIPENILLLYFFLWRFGFVDGEQGKLVNINRTLTWLYLQLSIIVFMIVANILELKTRCYSFIHVTLWSTSLPNSHVTFNTRRQRNEFIFIHKGDAVMFRTFPRSACIKVKTPLFPWTQELHDKRNYVLLFHFFFSIKKLKLVINKNQTMTCKKWSLLWIYVNTEAT